MTLNLAFWLSLALAVTGCTGMILAGRGMWQGWALGLCAQPIWAAFAIVSKGYGLLLTCLMYGTVYYRNLAKWRREATARKGSTCPNCGTPVLVRDEHYADADRAGVDWICRQVTKGSNHE